jgi:hypothetical protein
MNERNYPPTVLSQAKVLAQALKNIDPTLQVGDLTNAALEADLEKGVAIQRTLNILEIQLTDQRNKRDALYGEIWKKVKRLRAGVKAIYGDDSSEYEMAGGTRLSERKPRTRKKPANSQA